MLHIKFQGHRSVGSREKDVLIFFNIYGRGGQFGHVAQLICINFHFHAPIALIRNLVSKD